MTLFSTAPQPEAAARTFYDRFVAGGPDRLAWFTGVLGSLGMPTEPQAEHLDTVTGFVVHNLAVAGSLQPPLWWGDQFAKLGWTADGGCLTDGLVHYVAALYARELGATWQYRTGDAEDEYDQKPVMAPFVVAPPWRVVSMLAQIHRGREPVSRVSSVVASVLETGRRLRDEQSRGAVPPVGEALERVEVEVSQDSVGQYTHHVRVDEWAGFAMGEPAFRDLWERFEAVDGVRAVVHEDREVFLVEAPGAPSARLEAAFQRIVDDLVTEHRRR